MEKNKKIYIREYSRDASGKQKTKWVTLDFEMEVRLSPRNLFFFLVAHGLKNTSKNFNKVLAFMSDLRFEAA